MKLYRLVKVNELLSACKSCANLVVSCVKRAVVLNVLVEECALSQMCLPGPSRTLMVGFGVISICICEQIVTQLQQRAVMLP